MWFKTSGTKSGAIFWFYWSGCLPTISARCLSTTSGTTRMYPNPPSPLLPRVVFWKSSIFLWMVSDDISNIFKCFNFEWFLKPPFFNQRVKNIILFLGLVFYLSMGLFSSFFWFTLDFPKVFNVISIYQTINCGNCCSVWKALLGAQFWPDLPTGGGGNARSGGVWGGPGADKCNQAAHNRQRSWMWSCLRGGAASSRCAFTQGKQTMMVRHSYG